MAIPINHPWNGSTKDNYQWNDDTKDLLYETAALKIPLHETTTKTTHQQEWNNDKDNPPTRMKRWTQNTNATINQNTTLTNGDSSDDSNDKTSKKRAPRNEDVKTPENSTL